MPVTISYDVTDIENNQRTYIRSMLERFHWRRFGGSVFHYDGVPDPATTELHEDWLNHVVPALMFFRSYIQKNNITLKFFTVDASGTAYVDHSDPALLFGQQAVDGAHLPLNANPTNVQSSEKALRAFVDNARDAAG
ncbi:hypothetical protein [Rubinisphaera margarita]|uniref:hypothetical protein n=1 Tax=Rubinisphaera margarita TaxID=2909586 RepID=UPI001EE7C891|nr:hypothetical protein [Rubinisphaera margarita]MCG6156905.1 hypothetical protein [Rubinisphaera margarita]